MPIEVSKAVVEGGYWGQLRPRLVNTYVGDQGFVEILFHLLGPKEKKYEYQQHNVAQGSRYTDSVSRVEYLIHEKKYEDAIPLLLALVVTTEKKAKKTGEGVAPWSYEKLATIYRKQKRYGDEVAILERFERQPKASGALPKKLAERLIKARQLRDEKNA